MSKRTTSQYGSKKALNYVWNVAKSVPGKDPKLYRQDVYGNVAYKHSYGKDSPMGCTIVYQFLTIYKNKTIQSIVKYSLIFLVILPKFFHIIFVVV